MILIYTYLDILNDVHILFIHIYYLYSMVSTDRDHIRFLQIVIDDSNWGLAGTYGCFNRQPSQGGVHRHHGSGRLAQVYSMPYKNKWNMIAFAGTPCKELLDGQQTWNGWDSRSMAIGPNRTPFFGQSYVRSFFWNWSTIWMFAITFWLLGSFWRLVPSYFHGRSRPSGTTSSMARWRPSNPLLRKHACFWPFQSLRRCALMNKAWLRNHRRFRHRDLETTAQELPFRNYGSCTKVQELWLQKDFQRFRPLRLLLVCGTLKECESCRRHFVRVQHMSFCEHLCNCHYIQSFSPLAWIGMSFC